MGTNICVTFFAFLCLIALSNAQTQFLRWCVISEAEQKKCQDLKKVAASMYANRVPSYEVIPLIECVLGKDVYNCMEKIQDNDADIMALDTGQAYFGGRYYNMMPFLAEKYSPGGAGTGTGDGMNYYAVIVAKRGSQFNVFQLQDKRACFPGVGTAAGWLYPIGEFVKKNGQTNIMQVTECNAIVKTATNFFKSMCLPGALTSFYNPFGNNPARICELCSGFLEKKCSTDDPFAGYDGAFKCMSEDAGDVAFLRHDTVAQMAMNSSYMPDNYELLCPNGMRVPVTEYMTCNYGSIPANTVMTSSLKTKPEVDVYKNFLLKAAQWFGPSGQYRNQFDMFSSQPWGYFNRRNLLFTDSTQTLVDVGEKNTYYSWVDNDFYQIMEYHNACPLITARLCVISKQEKKKCEKMMMAFNAKDLRPSLDCIKGKGTDDCMKLISKGDADMVMLDPGDVYLAGKKYGLEPFVVEDYGNMNASVHVVAVARKRDHYMTLFNLKKKRACLPGIGRGDGWIIPMNIFIETEQFIPQHCTLFENLGQLFIHSCIPGAMDKDYNPNQKPVSLCEGCAAGGFRKCQRTSEDQYFSSSGAFRCLTEKGGDIAFVKHLTVRGNTDGRRQSYWARNRRSDDYELMCKDGRRTHIDDWENCHLGQIPASAMVTAKYKSEQDRTIFWQLLNYGQQFFSSDIEGDFHLFDSGTWYNDLIFSDDAVRLMRLDKSMQDYRNYLGQDFINKVENLHKYTCVPVKPSKKSSSSHTSISLLLLAAIFILQLVV